MKLFSIKALKALSQANAFTISQLAKKIGASQSAASRAVKELEQKKLVERDGRIVRIARNPASQQLLALSSKFSLENLFLGSMENILMALYEPRKITQISGDAGLSEVQAGRLIKKLKGVGAVYSNGGKIDLNEDVKKFVIEMKKITGLAGIEPYSTIIFSNSSRLKKVPLNAQAKGTLTAFSRFAEYGVEYGIIHDFYIEPAHEPGIEGVFVHALAAGASRKDMAMCLIFYEKNRARMEFRKIVELAREFKVMLLFFDCIAYLGHREVQEKGKFLPWKEFAAMAELYGIKNKSKQKFSADEIDGLLKEIGNLTVDHLEVFLIGGCNMALQGIKDSTKDIDLVVKNEKDFDAITSVLRKIGFNPLAKIESAYRKMNPSAILVCQGKPRVDIFTRKVCNALTLTGSMADRSLERKYGGLLVKFLRPEDIILFKAITDRDGDLDDITTIIQRQKPDWKYFIHELDKQHGKSERLFCLDVLGTFEVLEEKEKISFEIKEKLVDLCLEKSVLYLARKPVSVNEIMQKIDFPELTIRNKINQLVKNKKLAKLGGRPFQVQAIIQRHLG